MIFIFKIFHAFHHSHFCRNTVRSCCVGVWISGNKATYTNPPQQIGSSYLKPPLSKAQFCKSAKAQLSPAAGVGMDDAEPLVGGDPDCTILGLDSVNHDIAAV